jgi:hypothetical protein
MRLTPEYKGKSLAFQLVVILTKKSLLVTNTLAYCALRFKDKKK